MTGLVFNRKFTKEGEHPYDNLEWEKRDVKISDYDDNVVFEQKGVEVPKNWSQLATDIVASKYFRRDVPKIGKETSVKQLINRVATSIAPVGLVNGYFESHKDMQIFEDGTYLYPCKSISCI